MDRAAERAPELSPDGAIVVVGAGAAGATAARTVLRESEDREVVLLGAEPDAPYDRTELTKSVLVGTRPAPAALYPADLDDPRLSLWTERTVTDLSLDDHLVTLADGATVGYATLILATGASPRDLDVPGSGLDGVHRVRDRSTIGALRGALAAGGPVVVVGAGLIGLEVAAAARHHGAEVTVVEGADQVLGRIAPTVVADVVADEHRSRGARLELGRRPVAFLGDDGRVGGVALDDGRVLPAASVVVAVGVGPRTELAAAAGLEVDDGIVVDRTLRTSAVDVLAAGDVARVRDDDGRLGRRTEAWTPAVGAGVHAARTALGRAAPYTEVPWMWSDQLGLTVQAAGDPVDGLTPVVRGSAGGSDGLVVFGLAPDGRVHGVVGVSRGRGVARTVRAGRTLVERGEVVDPRRLADPDVDVLRLARDGVG